MQQLCETKNKRANKQMKDRKKGKVSGQGSSAFKRESQLWCREIGGVNRHDKNRLNQCRPTER